MARLGLALAVSAIVGCGSVSATEDAGNGNGNGDVDAGCEPGAFLACDGDDLVVCGAGGAAERTTCDFGCHPDEQHCNECEPESSTCAEDTEAVCGADGLLQARECPLGCNQDDTRCADIDPSNGLAPFLDDAAGGPELELPAGSVIDTIQGTILVNNELVPVPNAKIDAPEGGVEVRVFMVESLTVTGEVTVSGEPAVAFVSAGNIAIGGVVRLGHSGAGPDGNGSGAGDAITCNSFCFEVGARQSCAGVGGGGFGTAGRNGGAAGSVTGGSGGQLVGNEELVPLRGGGRSGTTSGRGGGAIQLVSRTSITVTNGGAIDAGGERGLGGVGGGAGGGILLEAPTVVVSGASSALAANGGGGGCRGDVTSEAESGRLDTARAAGCQSSDGGNGGQGSAGLNGTIGQSANGHCSTQAPWHGGGGGGGRGRIRINNLSASFAPSANAIVSPGATVGSIPLR